MSEQHDEGAIMEAINEALRRPDAFTNAATALVDAEERGYAAKAGADFWADIHEHVVPVLEVEARKKL